MVQSLRARTFFTDVIIHPVQRRSACLPKERMYPPLPAPEVTRKLLALHRKGLGSWEIRKIAFPSHPERYKVVLDSILTDPDKYDTDIDQVALDRAWAGDRRVWEGMTYYERQAFVDRLEKARDDDELNPRFPGRTAIQKDLSCGYGFGVKRGMEKGWIALLAEELGEPSERFLNILNKRRARDREREAKSA
jgi:hypothetical protein